MRQLYLEKDFTNSYVVYNVSSLSLTYPFVSTTLKQYLTKLTLATIKYIPLSLLNSGLDCKLY